MWEGLSLVFQGKNSKAEKKWSQALELCQKMEMKYEEALILYFRGKYLNREDDKNKASKLYENIHKREKVWKLSVSPSKSRDKDLNEQKN